MKRSTYTLSDEEAHVWRRLRDVNGDAFTFWCRVAAARGLDVGTIIGTEMPDGMIKFTALPVGHKRHWCWPFPLVCARPPQYFEDRSSKDRMNDNRPVHDGRAQERRLAVQAAWHQEW